MNTDPCNDIQAVRQRAFDTVLAHLRKQGRRAMAPHKRLCVYRNKEGLSCAIGALMDPFLALGRIGTLDSSDAQKAILPEYRRLVTEVGSMTFLYDLQSIHDKAAHWSPAGFNSLGEAEAAAVAHIFGLTYTPPETGESK